MPLHEIDTVKIEKQKAMDRYRRFNKIAKSTTAFQLCFAFLLFSWLISRSSANFPAAFELLRFALSWLCAIAVNHHFGFLIGNLIIITLFVKSGHSACNNRKPSAVAGIDDDGFQIRQFAPPDQTLSSEIATEEAVSGEKDTVPVEAKVVAVPSPPDQTLYCEIATVEAVSDQKDIVPVEGKVVAAPSPAEIEVLPVQRAEAEPKIYRRSRSEEFEPKAAEKIQLRRSETEPRREMEVSGEGSTGRRRIQEVEDLSNEEFQSKVEAFIERQQNFLREESLSMALRSRCAA